MGGQLARLLKFAPARYAWLQLGVKVGEPDIERLRSRISYRQLREWEHFFSFEGAVQTAAWTTPQKYQVEDLEEISADDFYAAMAAVTQK